MVNPDKLNEKLQELEDIETGSGGQNPTWPFDDPKNWEDAVGRSVIGEVIKFQKNVGKSGEYDILTLKPLKANHEIPDDIKRFSVFVSGTLKQTIMGQDVSEGDTLALKYHGHIEADNPNGYLHDFTCEVVERGESDKLLYPDEDIPF